MDILILMLAKMLAVVLFVPLFVATLALIARVRAR